MALQDTSSPGPPHDAAPTLRPAAQVMDLPRLGSMHASRLSFSRSLVRQMIRERWHIECERFALDAEGYGDAIYRVATPDGDYRFVVFAHYLAPDQRSDRVIANDWDLAFVLFRGEITPADLEALRVNVPRQEAGRGSSRLLTLSRANCSQRNFEAVVERLAAGQQPDGEWFKNVGYLYRTTAVYGNGKFGIADYDSLRHGSAFPRPFSAEMFTVYMVRHFALQQVEHIASQRSPDTAVRMSTALRRYLGIGNSTGLGMAPFLITHPQLIDRWIDRRETAIARILAETPTPDDLDRLGELAGRALMHLRETHTVDAEQAAADQRTIAELAALERWLGVRRRTPLSNGWRTLVRHAERRWTLQTQELLNSLLLELYPALVNPLENDMSVEEPAALDCGASLDDIRVLIETHYQWALAYDFSDPGQQRLFWYRAATKEEPRIGLRDRDIGADREMGLDIARAVRACYDAVTDYLATDRDADVIDFLLAHPAHRATVRRIQNVARLRYGDIRANLLAGDCRPLNLLRCKLSFFGASKFDPRSDRWVRITLFQGAPLVEDLAHADVEYDWFLPVAPDGTGS